MQNYKILFHLQNLIQKSMWTISSFMYLYIWSWWLFISYSFKHICSMNFFSFCMGSATKFLFLSVFQMLNDKHLICRSFCTLFPDWFYCLFNPKVNGFLGEQTLLIKAEHFQSLFGTTYGSVCRLPLMELSGTYDSIFMSWSCSSWFWRFLSKTKCIHHKTT